LCIIIIIIIIITEAVSQKGLEFFKWHTYES